jgi:hypothetical protein
LAPPGAFDAKRAGWTGLVPIRQWARQRRQALTYAPVGLSYTYDEELLDRYICDWNLSKDTHGILVERQVVSDFGLADTISHSLCLGSVKAPVYSLVTLVLLCVSPTSNFFGMARRKIECIALR